MQRCPQKPRPQNMRFPGSADQGSPSASFPFPGAPALPDRPPMPRPSRTSSVHSQGKAVNFARGSGRRPAPRYLPRAMTLMPKPSSPRSASKSSSGVPRTPARAPMPGRTRLTEMKRLGPPVAPLPQAAGGDAHGGSVEPVVPMPSAPSSRLLATLPAASLLPQCGSGGISGAGSCPGASRQRGGRVSRPGRRHAREGRVSGWGATPRGRWPGCPGAPAPLHPFGLQSRCTQIANDSLVSGGSHRNHLGASDVLAPGPPLCGRPVGCEALSHPCPAASVLRPLPGPTGRPWCLPGLERQG